ncbi:MAG: hypothetical protein P8P29_00735 [Flavobacteriaceae bacterium]|nr:hypothetical protein [Flavobacteriaceae bacterium]
MKSWDLSKDYNSLYELWNYKKMLLEEEHSKENTSLDIEERYNLDVTHCHMIKDYEFFLIVELETIKNNLWNNYENSTKKST